MSDKIRKIIFIIVILSVAGAILFLESRKIDISPSDTAKDATINIPLNDMTQEEKLAQYSKAKELTSIAGYINTDDTLTIQNLIGKKVILLDIWTYSCINCQRTLPYITNWYEKYKDQGLEIIGVHTPEFAFEKVYDNVVRATKQWGIEYPVVLDNDYGTWHAYQNRYWPRKYIIDIDGFVVYDHIGEGGYEETEKKIQELLRERAKKIGDDMAITTEIATPENVEEVDSTKRRSPETYLGASRNNRLGNGEQGSVGTQTLSEPEGLKTHILYLDGEWDLDPEFAENKNIGAKIVYRYQAEKVFLVARSDEGVRATILIDGKPIGERAGSGVDKDGTVLFKEDRLYRLVEDPNGWGEHTLEIIFEDAGAQVFAFTFG